MRDSDKQFLLEDKRVIDAINKHLWIESQKAGYSIGLERATNEWVELYAMEWMKYNMADRYEKMRTRKRKRVVKSEKK